MRSSCLGEALGSRFPNEGNAIKLNHTKALSAYSANCYAFLKEIYTFIWFKLAYDTLLSVVVH